MKGKGFTHTAHSVPKIVKYPKFSVMTLSQVDEANSRDILKIHVDSSPLKMTVIVKKKLP